MTTETHTIVINRGTSRERVEVVKPLTARGEKTLVAFVRGASVATKWVSTARISVA